ncbi:MAG: lysophospholipid acyltransferase family protein [Candidatus Aminicenantes bacterium]|nr:lysophospholipid acyltransferase family protein [Candidatus Aminicenantes bacterium]
MKRILESLRSILLWIVAFPVFIVCVSSILVTALVYRGRRLEPLIKWSCRLILFAAGIRLRVRGREHVEPGRQYIILMNHVNLFDPFVFYASFPGLARGLEEERHFSWPLYGAMLRRIGMIPVDRGNSVKARASLDRAARLIQARPDFSVLVLPEGTRTRDGKLGRFKSGAFRLAAASGLDILPMAQTGGYRINRRGSRMIRPGRVDVLIGPPIPSAGVTADNHAVLLERARAWFLNYVE